MAAMGMCQVECARWNVPCGMCYVECARRNVPCGMCQVQCAHFPSTSVPHGLPSIRPADLNGDAAVTEGAAPGGALTGQGVASGGGGVRR